MISQRLTEGEFWADKLMDLANLAVVILVFGQLVAPKIYFHSIALGVIIYIIFSIISFKFRKKHETR